MNGFIQVATTFETKSDAEQLGRLLVEKRLCGCVQILGPMTSIFRWRGKIEQVEEFLCLIKSHEELFAELERTIKANHPYQCPQIVALSIKSGSGDYLDWLRHELKEI
ncbi:MAG: hypothetical protein A2511_03160 [Deltaproteobacteria bacterium RIFOXYD12_FULL_50_9]|nr:MAG: hypothetical protein A2511_03160 [Deltaproteobacteria bacterium RIFOXYD12_FULL_50_9]